jgi:hypothetical protein
MDFAEKAAKNALEAVLPGAKLTYRDQQGNGEYDFDLQYPDGRLAAVEVTCSVDQLQMQTLAAIHSRKKSPVIAASRCKKTWWITPMRNANINAVREKADAYLATLEDAGITEFSAFEVNESKQIKVAGLHSIFGDRVVPECVEFLCDDLMLQAGGVISSEESPKIILGFPIYGGAVGPECAINAGKTEAWKDDNRKKLGAATTNERHLVTLMHVMNGLAWTALTDSDPPVTLPELPPEIDHIWLLGDIGGRAANKFVVWRASKTMHWQKLVVDLPTTASPVHLAS